MAISDLVYNSDLAHPPYGCDCGGSGSGDDDKKCNCNSAVYFLPPPDIDVSKFPLYPPYPYWPPCPPPPHPHPHPDDDDDQDVKPGAVEKQICKKSREAATICKIIENLEEKNKSLIVKSGGVSYALGTLKYPDPEDSESTLTDESIETIIGILKAKLEIVKDEIRELSEQIGE